MSFKLKETFARVTPKTVYYCFCFQVSITCQSGRVKYPSLHDSGSGGQPGSSLFINILISIVLCTIISIFHILNVCYREGESFILFHSDNICPHNPSALIIPGLMTPAFYLFFSPLMSNGYQVLFYVDIYTEKEA